MRSFKRIGACLFMFVIAFASISLGGTEEASAAGDTYYVSPTGNDASAGTDTAPWKTLDKAAKTLQAGDTAVFEDGTYHIKRVIRFTNNGTEDNPITIKARNKQQAKLLFNGLNTTSKIRLDNKKSISIEDFEITQDESGTASGDTFIHINDCSDCTISGNAIHGAGGKAVQALDGEHIKVANNELYNFGNFGVVLANIDRPIIADNEIRDVSVAILVPAGT